MKYLIGIGTYIKSHIVVSIITCLVVVGGITTGIIIFNRNDVDNKKELQQIENKQELRDIILKDKLEFEINDNITVSSLISEDNKVRILSGDSEIDTSILGEKEIIIKYISDDKEKEKKVYIKVIDTIAPTIEFDRELSTVVGTRIDLLKNVKVIDNSKENIKVIVDGKYDFNKDGIYNLKYIAIDSSNNRVEEKFILKVIKNSISNNSGPADLPNNRDNSSSKNDNNSNNSSSENKDSNGNNINRNGINLNENVMYYEYKNNVCGGRYVHIKDSCKNKTIKQLKEMYPDYDKSIDEYGYESETLESAGYIFMRYFSGCEEDITQSLVSQISNDIRGYKVVNYHGSGISLDIIEFEDSKYEKFKSFSESRYNLINPSGCGSVDEKEYKVLDEAMCTKYSLSCNRW